MHTHKEGFSIGLEQICFRFSHTDEYFFKDLTVMFDGGGLYFIHGRNGAGKSTLFRILQGDIGSDEDIQGRLILNGVHYTITSPDELQRIIDSRVSMVHQRFDEMLADRFTYLQNLAFANMSHRPALRSLVTTVQYKQLIDAFSIPQECPVRLLSGGQRQIVAISMVLQKHPRILLLDEPTAALDSKNAAMVFAFLRALVDEHGLTILVISHDQSLSAEYALDGMYELANGRVTQVA